MPDIHIEREHSLGLARARELAFKWAEAAEDKLDMECTYEEGKTSDLVSFTRSGVDGELRVTRDRFELHARLGLLLGVFRERIESEITSNLDRLLEHGDPVTAFEKGVAEATGRRVAKEGDAGKAAAAGKAAKPAARSRKA
ncbi:polyhydroxyalkanoic acid system family protein [Ramlibacter tataouinensis]|uniref:polyhydroxyalkanoic acid system family protein n=1 Tax=Ramlibacter tataouinensis TaxID=94132 RepID=UPI0022F3A1AD|nr:polyhydroxyalkanoic acid system family protein [Ramlibacter tataouinensis]WBY00694.1 polyhydroxyalkanoic acid system family protein [Ramlibacter tataouinensis]